MTSYEYENGARLYLPSLSVLDDPLIYRLNQGVNLIYTVAGSTAFLNRTSTEVANAFQR